MKLRLSASVLVVLSLSACGSEDDLATLADTVSDLKASAAVVEANDPAGDGSNVEATADTGVTSGDTATCTDQAVAVNVRGGRLLETTATFSGAQFPAAPAVLFSLPNQAGGATVAGVDATGLINVSNQIVDLKSGLVTVSAVTPYPSPSVNPRPSPSPGLFAFRGKAVRLPGDGAILYIGGSLRRSIKSRPLATIHRFDIAGEHTVLASKLLKGRAGHAAFRIDDTHVLIVGGFDADAKPVAEIEIIDTALLSTTENTGVTDTGLVLKKPRFNGI
ncbi:MAG: hypothetical protein AAB425_03530, partial [Bdellovibrionota bacterium]